MHDEEITQVIGCAEWNLEPLTHNASNAVTGGIWRVRCPHGTAVLKVITRRKAAHEQWRASDDPRHWNYWRREADVYADGLPGLWREAGVRAPELLALVEREDGDLALWTEDVEGLPGGAWTIEEHARLGHRLGAAQGAAGEVERPWLSRSFLRDYVGSKQVSYELLDDDEVWSRPLVRDNVPAGLRAELIRLHRDREWFMDLLDSLPRALCHLDLWPNNVLATGAESVLLDWAFTGDGALGEDIGNHIPDSVFDLFLPAASLPELDRAVYGSYVRGLCASGWRGDERLVRLAVCASAVKYDWLMPFMLARVGEQQVDYGGAGTVDAARRYRERGEALMFLAAWADEARRLAGSIPARPPVRT